jgi:predicted dinucleotide-binding enzyme
MEPKNMANRLASTSMDRRQILGAGLGGAVLLATATGPVRAQSGQKLPKIGIIGAGHIGSTVGPLWIKAGHEVMFSSRHPETLKSLTDPLGPNAKAGTVEEAIAFGQVVFIAIPYTALPALGRDYGKALAGKIVLDACNPVANRDDAAVVEDAKANGVGPTSAKYLGGAAREVRAFNALSAKTLGTQGNRAGELIALPIAGADDEAVKVAATLVREIGFEPVIVPFTQTNLFGPGGPGYVKDLSAPALRAALGLS